MTNTKKTTEQRFDNTFDLDDFGKSHIVNNKVKQFIRVEQSRLLKEILEKRKGYKHGLLGDPGYVLIEDIQQIAKEWGIDL